MTFQNCILIYFVVDARTDKPKAICPLNFSKVGGIKMKVLELSQHYAAII